MAYKVCLAGTSTPADGTTTFETLDDAQAWLANRQVYYADGDPEKPLTDGSKYVVLPSDME